MKNIKIASAQFENRSGDKAYNLAVIRQLTAQAAQKGADVVAFHECSITGYSFARHLSKEQMLEVAEFVPDGPSIKQLITIAKEFDIAILAGLFENPYADAKAAQAITNNPEARALAVQAARETTVLLKNDGLLPLTTSMKTLEQVKFVSKQQLLYLDTFLAPSLPDEPEYPQRALWIAGIFGATLLAWSAVFGILANLRNRLA